MAALVSLRLLVVKCEPTAFHTTAGDNTLLCHDDFMSVYIPKEQFYHLPSTIYVGGKSGQCPEAPQSREVCVLFSLCVCHPDDGSGYYQVAAIAERCLYFLKETLSFIVLTVASTGCFVKRQVSSWFSFVVLFVTQNLLYFFNKTVFSRSS